MCCSLLTQKVSWLDGQMLADELKCEFFETSAADNININDPFMRLIELVMQRRRQKQQTSDSSSADKFAIVDVCNIRRKKGWWSSCCS